jgi:hypothetical protein
METKYSKEKFDGFTHRFKIQFETGEPYEPSIDLYSNSDSYQELEDFINEKNSERVLSFKIIHRATNEQDEKTAELIDKWISEDK